MNRQVSTHRTVAMALHQHREATLATGISLEENTGVDTFPRNHSALRAGMTFTQRQRKLYTLRPLRLK